VVGVAGGAAKCRYVVEQLGFDACVDHKEEDLPRRLLEACPAGVDVYWENVGGACATRRLTLCAQLLELVLLGLILCLYIDVIYGDQKEEDLPRRLLEACPAGVDVYWENVGGACGSKPFDLVLHTTAVHHWRSC
jgi:NADPH-dependent curcumin reductase